MDVTLAIYQRKEGDQLSWMTLGLGPYTQSQSGKSAVKMREGLVDALRRTIKDLPPRELELFQMRRGLRLERVRLELTLKGEGKRRKMSGLFPLIVEPRWATREQRISIAYHPLRQNEWLPLREDEPIETQASLYFASCWAELGDIQVWALQTDQRDLVKAVSFIAHPRSLVDQLPRKKQGIWDDLEPETFAGSAADKRGSDVLPQIGTNQTPRAVEGTLDRGMPREPYRGQLAQLLLGEKLRPVIVVGRSGVGKTTLLNQWIHDLIAADGYETHRNLDKVRQVWAISGKRIIAGMSYFGDWEKRCLQILEAAKRRRVVLWVEDLQVFGRIGQSRSSDRSLADFFRGPIQRGDLVMVGECTPEQLQRLEDEAPSFAALFTRIHVAETDAAESMKMILHEARRLELTAKVALHPFVLRTLLELGGSLFPGVAFPGKALDLLRQLVKDHQAGPHRDLGPEDAIAFLAAKTGLPPLLLQPEQALEERLVKEHFSRSVMGQERAIEAASDLILKIRAGLLDPRRPYAVYLFTGPTGTGKTELAGAIASYLYGDKSRLIRFDMSELSSPDAPARLIGDRWQPEGLLTQQMRDQPFSVVLLDEIEKAHPSVLNLLLQLFDEGRLTDAAGNAADFTHAVVIMTSNLGSRARSPIGIGDASLALMQDIQRAVKEFFPPELFNRIDRVVPFSPLTPAVARAVAQKEIARLLARRGLTDRSVFVRVNSAVLEKVVAEAFDPRDGARPVKRWLEDRLGSMLAEHIAEGPRAAMQLARVYHDGRSLRLHAEPLVEAEPSKAPFPLEALLERPVEELKAHLAAKLVEIQRWIDSGVLGELASQIDYHLEEHNQGRLEHADALYHLDEIRTQLEAARERGERLVRGHGPATEPEDPEHHSAVAMPRRMRDELLEALSELHFLERAIGTVHARDQHAVLIELFKVGQAQHVPGRLEPGEAGLLSALVHAYAASGRGEVESSARLAADGRIETTIAPAAQAGGFGWTLVEPNHVVLKVVGLSVRDFFDGETGCHIWQSLARGSELVRVRVLAAKLAPAEHLTEQIRAAERFEAALEAGTDPLPENPQRLLPAVRRIRFDPPDQQGGTAPLEVEDYPLGHSATVRVRAIGEVLPRLWAIRLSSAL